MALQDEISAARKLIYRDGYDMSFGEIANLYEKGELVIDPEYQRLFRWSHTQKSRFVESLLLNIPVPPIFVFSGNDGKWELVDGLQRTSTVLELMGLLREPENGVRERLVCGGTTLLPSLDNKKWKFDDEEAGEEHLPQSAQFDIKRRRIRVEILGPETDTQVKFELFQRLNTGGSNLSPQEIRNCIIISVNKDAYKNIVKMAGDANFQELIDVGTVKEERQYISELVVRFIVYRNQQYDKRLDVHDYLDAGIVSICDNDAFDWDAEMNMFAATYREIAASIGKHAFRKNNRFSLAYFEFLSVGVASYIAKSNGKIDRDHIKRKFDEIQDNPIVQKQTGAGVRGTTRISNIIFPYAFDFF